MATSHKPRSGSLQYWPRKRSKRIYPRVRSWALSKDVSLAGFFGYKAGMTHVMAKDTRANSLTKGSTISVPVTVVECPPIKIYSLRLYKKNIFYGSRVLSEIVVASDKELKRKVRLTKKSNLEEKKKELESKLENADDLRVLIYAQPKLTGIGKKKPELMEMAVSGSNVKEKYDYVNSLIGKEIKVSDILAKGKLVDIHSVSIGKGFQGSVKRFGVALKGHKSEKKRRAIGNLGAWTPKRVSWTIGLPGGMGYHARTEFNKEVLLINDKPEEVNPKGGFLHYGLVKNDYILIKGSVPGPVKRPIRIANPQRKQNGTNLEITRISLRSKQ